MPLSLAMITASLAALAAHPTPTAMSTTSQQQSVSERADLGDGFYMITGNGGNILFSTGAEGTFIVDSQYANVAAENLALITEVTDKPIVFVLNTHFHGDHTGGNKDFSLEGAMVIAHENVRERLVNTPEAREIDPHSLPVMTFSENTSFHWDGREIRIHHIGTAHTDGDAVVHIPNSNLIHTGDIMFLDLYPFIDLNGGGSVNGTIKALTKISEMADKDTRIVPGHGPLGNKTDVEGSISMLKETRALVRDKMMKGMSREDIIAADPLKDYNESWSWRFINGERMTGTHFDDLLATDEDAKAAVMAGQ